MDAKSTRVRSVIVGVTAIGLIGVMAGFPSIADARRVLLEEMKSIEYSSAARDLSAAAILGDVAAVKRLIDQGAPINEKDVDGWTPLMKAATEGHVVVVRTLLDNRVDVNAKGIGDWTALMCAANGGHSDVVALLKKYGAKVTLLEAAIIGNVKEAERLISKGAHVNDTPQYGWSALMHAAYKGRLEVVRLLLDHGAQVDGGSRRGATSLMWAISNGHWDVAKLLMERGAAIDPKGEFGLKTLTKAAGDGRLDIVTLLLNKGAKVNAVDAFGRTALMSAAEGGHLNVLNVLLGKGANLKATNKFDQTALMLAALRGHVDVTKALLDRGAEINAINKSGHTALMLAAWGGSLDVSRLLLDKGADLGIKDKSGRNALAVAEETGHHAIAKLIRDKGPITDTRGKHDNTAHFSPQAKDRRERLEMTRTSDRKAAAAQRIARFSDKVLCQGAELFFRLRDGTIVSRRDTPPSPWDGYTDAAGNVMIRYDFYDFIDPYYVVREGYFEGHGTEFINQDTGATVDVRGFAYFSPDKNHLVASGYPGESRCYVDIWKVSPAGIVRKWISVDLCGHGFRWSDKSTVEVLRNAKVIARVKLDGGSWKFSSVPKKHEIGGPSHEVRKDGAKIKEASAEDKSWTGKKLTGVVQLSKPKYLMIRIVDGGASEAIKMRVGLKTKFIPFRRPAVGEKVEVKYREENGVKFAYQIRVIP